MKNSFFLWIKVWWDSYIELKKRKKSIFFPIFLPGRLDKSNQICLVHLTSYFNVLSTDFYVRNRNCQNMFLKFIQKVFTVYVLHKCPKSWYYRFSKLCFLSSWMWKKFLKKIFLSIFLWDFKSRIFFRVNKCLYGNWAFAFTSLMADLH